MDQKVLLTIFVSILVFVISPGYVYAAYSCNINCGTYGSSVTCWATDMSGVMGACTIGCSSCDNGCNSDTGLCVCDNSPACTDTTSYGGTTCGATRSTACDGGCTGWSGGTDCTASSQVCDGGVCVECKGDSNCNTGEYCSLDQVCVACDNSPACTQTTSDTSNTNCGATRPSTTACQGGCETTSWSGGTDCTASSAVCVSGTCCDYSPACSPTIKYVNNDCGAVRSTACGGGCTSWSGGIDCTTTGEVCDSSANCVSPCDYSPACTQTTSDTSNTNCGATRPSTIACNGGCETTSWSGGTDCTASSKVCNSAGNCITASSCTGTLSLSISPNSVPAGGSVTPSASGLSGCSKTIYFKKDSCTGTQVSSCSSADTGCTGGSFTALTSEGVYAYVACVDKDGNNDFSGTGESGSADLAVETTATFPSCSSATPAVTSASWSVANDCWGTPQQSCTGGLSGCSSDCNFAENYYTTPKSAVNDWLIPKGKWKVAAEMKNINSYVKCHGWACIGTNCYAQVVSAYLAIGLDNVPVKSQSSSGGASVSGDGTQEAAKAMSAIQFATAVDCTKDSGCNLNIRRYITPYAVTHRMPWPGGGGDFHYEQATADVSVTLQQFECTTNDKDDGTSTECINIDASKPFCNTATLICGECLADSDCASKADCADNRYYLKPKACSASNTCVDVVGGNVYSDGYAYCGQGDRDIAANCGNQACGGSTYYCTNDGTSKLWRLTKPAEVCDNGLDNDCDSFADAADSEIECCSATDCKGTDDGTYNTFCPKDEPTPNYVLPTCDPLLNLCQCESSCGSFTGANAQCASGYCCTGENPQGPSEGAITSQCVQKSTVRSQWLCT